MGPRDAGKHCGRNGYCYWRRHAGQPDVYDLEEAEREDSPRCRKDSMTRERFLTVRWNNLLSLGMGLIPLVYVVVASTSSMWSGRGGLIGLAVIGVLY